MPGGRPTKYTPETIEKFLNAVRLGSPLSHACNYAGISFETLCQWRRTYPEFSDSIKLAEGEGVKSCLDVITQAAVNGNWSAAAWRLERRYPHDFGRRDRMPIDERELQQQFEAEMAGLEAGGETGVSSGTESEAVN